MEYILSDKNVDCVFCQKIAAHDDKANHILLRGDHACIILNLYPYNNGHLMIIPYDHKPNLEELSDEVLIEMMFLVKRSLTLLREAMHPQGFNIGVNIGRAAGAGVGGHVHIHVVPRWEGDTNFMTLFARVRVVPEMVDDTYDRLQAVLKELNLSAGSAGQGNNNA